MGNFGLCPYVFSFVANSSLKGPKMPQQYAKPVGLYFTAKTANTFALVRNAHHRKTWASRPGPTSDYFGLLMSTQCPVYILDRWLIPVLCINFNLASITPGRLCSVWFSQGCLKASAVEGRFVWSTISRLFTKSLASRGSCSQSALGHKRTMGALGGKNRLGPGPLRCELLIAGQHLVENFVQPGSVHTGRLILLWIGNTKMTGKWLFIRKHDMVLLVLTHPDFNLSKPSSCSGIWKSRMAQASQGEGKQSTKWIKMNQNDTNMLTTINLILKFFPHAKSLGSWSSPKSPDLPSSAVVVSSLFVPKNDRPREDVPLDLGFEVLGQQGMDCHLILEGEVAKEHPKHHHPQAPRVAFEGVPGWQPHCKLFTEKLSWHLLIIVLTSGPCVICIHLWSTHFLWQCHWHRATGVEGPLEPWRIRYLRHGAMEQGSRNRSTDSTETPLKIQSDPTPLWLFIIFPSLKCLQKPKSMSFSTPSPCPAVWHPNCNKGKLTIWLCFTHDGVWKPLH